MNKSALAHPDSEAIAATAARWVARHDAGMSVAERMDFERWLGADTRHASAWKHYDVAWSILDRPRRAGATDAVLRQLVHTQRGRRRQRQAAVASLSLLMLVAVVWQWPDRTTPPSPLAPASAVVVRPERRTLPDGSIAELKAGAEIEVNFDAATRRIALRRGEAHFEVATNRARPFVVEAGSVYVRALGTAFAVQLGGAQVEVLVTEGTVAVDRTLGPALVTEPSRAGDGRRDEMKTSHSPRESVGTVGAGHRLVVSLGQQSGSTVVGTAQPVTASELNERLSWRSPRLEFSSTPLAEAIALMNRSATPRNGTPQIQLTIDPSSTRLGEEPISGLFRADNVEAFVHMLELSLGVKAEHRGKDEIVLRKVFAPQKPN